jgi:hypothetical protein
MRAGKGIVVHSARAWRERRLRLASCGVAGIDQRHHPSAVGEHLLGDGGQLVGGDQVLPGLREEQRGVRQAELPGFVGDNSAFDFQNSWSVTLAYQPRVRLFYWQTFPLAEWSLSLLYQDAHSADVTGTCAARSLTFVLGILHKLGQEGRRIRK